MRYTYMCASDFTRSFSRTIALARLYSDLGLEIGHAGDACLSEERKAEQLSRPSEFSEIYSMDRARVAHIFFFLSLSRGLSRGGFHFRRREIGTRRKARASSTTFIDRCSRELARWNWNCIARDVKLSSLTILREKRDAWGKFATEKKVSATGWNVDIVSNFSYRNHRIEHYIGITYIVSDLQEYRRARRRASIPTRLCRQDYAHGPGNVPRRYFALSAYRWFPELAASRKASLRTRESNRLIVLNNNKFTFANEGERNRTICLRSRYRLRCYCTHAWLIVGVNNNQLCKN